MDDDITDAGDAADDFRGQRLFVVADLAAGSEIELSREQANYLLNVLRLDSGGRILVFNGRDGEWRAVLRRSGRRDASLAPIRQIRPQTKRSSLSYLFAPLKRTRLDYMVQKATEMGASHMQPVMTQRTVAERVNLDRMRANVIEAAEQCGILSVPDVASPTPLTRLLETWDVSCRLVFCDEGAPIRDPIAALRALTPGPVAVLIGPEGGFSDAERAALTAVPQTVRISLGPRIMRADTAAVAALALVNAVLGDWR